MEWARTRCDGTGYKISGQITGNKEGNWSPELLCSGQVCTHIHTQVQLQCKRDLFVIKSLNTAVREMRPFI